MTRSLVVGAAGFVGHYLVDQLLAAGDTVCAATFDGTIARDTSLGEDGGRLTVTPLDITKPKQCAELLERVKPDVVYHLAGIAFVPEAEEHFDSALSVNVFGTSNLVRHCYLTKLPTSFVFISSAEVYGHVAPQDLPIDEETPLRPANNYSLSKRMAELVMERYSRSDRVRVSIARPFNHIGPGQDSRFVVSNFALQLARIARGLSAPVLEVGNLEARRDFSDVRDIARAYRLMAERGDGIYNLGSGTARSIQSIVDDLIRISGANVNVRQDPARARGPEVPELYADCGRARDTLGWEPRIAFETSLTDVYRHWYDRLGAENVG